MPKYGRSTLQPLLVTRERGDGERGGHLRVRVGGMTIVLRAYAATDLLARPRMRPRLCEASLKATMLVPVAGQLADSRPPRRSGLP